MKPLHSEFIPTADLIHLVAARILSQRPELGGGQAWVIEIVVLPGRGIRLDVLGAPEAPR
ncbi:MAG TPA: hypothetical protein VM689_13490 [Aliidongia sp.]|nr:hypothetical protein [Aliidongia sp.]